MAAAELQVVFLGQKGEIRQGKLKSKSITLTTCMTALKKKEAPSLLGKSFWKQKQRTLYFFGYLDGKDSTENQHHLPTPLEGMTFYGDILVIASTSPTSYEADAVVSLKTADYETFYTSNLEGEDSDEESGDSEDEEGDAQEDAADDDEGGVLDDDDVLSEAGDGSVDDDDDDDDSLPPIEKPVRVSRVRKSAIQQSIVEEPEIELEDSYETSPNRVQVNTVIQTRLNLEGGKSVELEAIIYRNAMQTATTEEIRKSWKVQAFCDVYLALARRIIGNLDPNSYIQNKNLWLRYSTGELTLEDIVKQNYYELCPENWQTLVDRQAKREQIQLEGDFSRATDKWMCNGCKQRKCTYYELQTRSADEPMTIFIHCLNCGKRWTQ